MNDRFKFRVWDKIRNKFIESPEPTPLLQANGLLAYFKDEEYMNNYVIQFCTGLKDKNGKLIYEGDILRQPQLPQKVICEWYKDGFWLNGFLNGAKRELRNMHNWYEVIGNIYENKELLED